MQLVGTRKAAGDLGVSDKTLRRLAAEDRVPHARVGKLLRFDPEALAEWVRRGGSAEDREGEAS